MSTPHPSFVLLLSAGLMISWLLPLSSYLLLQGLRDRKAQIWFNGAWLYAVAVTAFLAGPLLPGWIPGPLTMGLAATAVLCFGEALRRELSPSRAPLGFYAGLVGVEFALLMALYETGHFGNWGRVVHLLLIATLDVWVGLLALRILRQRGGRALYLVALVFLLFALINIARAGEFFLTGQISDLRSFRFMGNLGWMANYMGGILYCYGYWGFVMEKARSEEAHALAQAVLARERQQLAEQTLAERNALMEQVASMGKMAQSGALTASLTHEINQPLTAALLNVQQAQAFAREAGGDTRIAPLLERSVQETLRAAETLRQVKAMFTPGAPRCEPIDPHAVVRFAAAMMERALREARVQLQLQLQGEPVVLFSQGEFEHVLLNLFHNAIDAMQERPAEQRRIRVSAWQDGAQFMLSFEDTGVGVAPQERPHIFEMNVSSKAQHMGMGLWLARFIMDRHGGRIWLDEAHTGGARFLLALPLAPAAPADILRSKD